MFIPDKRRFLSLEDLIAFFERVSRRQDSIHLNEPLHEGEYGWSSIEDVFTFNHKLNPSLKVQVVVAQPRSAPIACVLHFHSTLVMNFITWDRAYSLFPSATFLHHSALTFGDAEKDPRLPTVYDKYWQRGFRVSASPFITTDLAKHFKWGGRRIDDEQSWVIELNTEELFAASDGLDRDESIYQYTHMTAGFTLLNQDQNKYLRSDVRRNPDRSSYMESQAVILYRVVDSLTLRSALILPLVSEESSLWNIPHLINAQERFERAQAKVAYPAIDRWGEMNPVIAPGWKYWDREALDLVRSGISDAIRKNQLLG